MKKGQICPSKTGSDVIMLSEDQTAVKSKTVNRLAFDNHEGRNPRDNTNEVKERPRR